MPNPEHETAPGGVTRGGAINDRVGAGSLPTLPDATDPRHLAALIDGAFVVIVEINGGRHQRRCFLSLSAAERHANRAVARGQAAHIVLAHLRSICHVPAGDAR